MTEPSPNWLWDRQGVRAPSETGVAPAATIRNNGIMFGPFRSLNRRGATSRVRRWTEDQLSAAQTSVHELGAIALLWHIIHPFDRPLAGSREAGRALGHYVGDSALFEITSYTTFKIDYWCHVKARRTFGDAFMPYFMRFVASVFEREGRVAMAGELLNSRMRLYAEALRVGEPADLFNQMENLVAHTKGGAPPYKDAAHAPLVVDDALDRVHLRSFLVQYETDVFPLVIEKCELLAKEF